LKKKLDVNDFLYSTIPPGAFGDNGKSWERIFKASSNVSISEEKWLCKYFFFFQKKSLPLVHSLLIKNFSVI